MVDDPREAITIHRALPMGMRQPVRLRRGAQGDDPGVVTGVFVGTTHEGAAGMLEHPGLFAAFGAVRE